MPSVGWPACMRAAKPGEGANVITPIGTRRGRIPIATAELLHTKYVATPSASPRLASVRPTTPM